MDFKQQEIRNIIPYSFQILGYRILKTDKTDFSFSYKKMRPLKGLIFL